MNPQKTTIVPFTRRRKVTLKLLQLERTTIEYSSQVKYLGIILDSKLNWGSHLEHVITKASNALWLSHRTFGKKWGLKPRMIFWIYTVIVRPRISYASLVWWPKVKVKAAQLKLGKLQRLACLAITGAMRSSPSKALDALLCLLPLHQYLKNEAAKTALRLEEITNFLEGDLVGHMEIIKYLYKDPVMAMQEDWMPTRLNLDIPYEAIEVDRRVWESGGPEVAPGSIIFFTDGSKTVDGTGAGVTGPGINISIPMGKWTTVFISEIYAILECAAICLQRKYRNARINIFSDSQAALKALVSSTCQSKLVWECSSLLKQVSVMNHVKLYWVPGHCGVDGNEKADALARQGSSDQFIGPEPFCGVSRSIKKYNLKDQALKQLQDNWNREHSMRQSKLFITPDIKKTNKLLSLNKKSLSTIVGLFTGHCPCRYHLKKLEVISSEVCRFCDSEKETAEHLLCKCGALFTRRRIQFGKSLLSANEIQLIDPNKIVEFIFQIIPDWSSWSRQEGTVIHPYGNMSS